MDRFWHNGLQAGPTWPKMHGTKADWGGKKNSFRNCFAALGASGGHTGGPRGPPLRPRAPHGTNKSGLKIAWNAVFFFTEAPSRPKSGFFTRFSKIVITFYNFLALPIWASMEVREKSYRVPFLIK